MFDKLYNFYFNSSTYMREEEWGKNESCTDQWDTVSGLGEKFVLYWHETKLTGQFLVWTRCISEDTWTAHLWTHTSTLTNSHIAQQGQGFVIHCTRTRRLSCPVLAAGFLHSLMFALVLFQLIKDRQISIVRPWRREPGVVHARTCFQ